MAIPLSFLWSAITATRSPTRLSKALRTFKKSSSLRTRWGIEKRIVEYERGGKSQAGHREVLAWSSEDLTGNTAGFPPTHWVTRGQRRGRRVRCGALDKRPIP